MLKIDRSLKEKVNQWLFREKIITIYGARQVGKTTLVKSLLKDYNSENHYYDCEFMHVRKILESQNPSEYHRLFDKAKLIVLDEAQRVANIGIILKLLHDHFPTIQIIATGSSSFDLANKIHEPLTGRGMEFTLYPFSIEELSHYWRFDELKSRLESLLIYGSYPEIIFSPANDQPILLENLASKYLYNDILTMDMIKKSDVLVKLLQLLALQVGSEVSLHELAINLQIHPKTVENYLCLLEKTFVIFRLKPFSNNLRKVITRKNKIYFWDLGIRNALLAQFNSLALRYDIGALWENFCIIERLKLREYHQKYGQVYFWRDYSGQEIDYIESYDGKLYGYEMKWQSPRRYKPPKVFIENYVNVEVQCIHQENIWDFLQPAGGINVEK